MSETIGRKTPGGGALHQFHSFGDYEILGEIAGGGMGMVYLARQISLNRTVALKMIRSGHLAAAAEVQRFRTEAEAAANLDHSHIVPIYEIGEHEGHHYFTMKLMEGGTLAELIAQQWNRRAAVSLSPLRGEEGRSATALAGNDWLQRTAQLVTTIARAVHHAHQRGVLHRDIKPTNILLDDRGEPHLTDFGLAKLVQGRADFTQSIAVLGTPGYMAPEQAAGRVKELTTAADIYGLGAILYDLLTGRPPFEGDSTLEILNQVQEQEPERPSKLNLHLDRDLETICLKCLEKEPQRRYATAETLAQDLERWLAGEPIQARPAKSWERVVKWTRRNPVVASLSAAAALIFFAGLVGVLWQWREARLHATRADENAERAASSADESRQRLVRSYVANGNRLVDEGDPFTALLWFGEALRLDESNAVQSANHRLRLATTLRQAPRLLQICVHGSPLMAAAFNDDGRRMLTAGRDGIVWVWDVETGERVVGPLKHPTVVSQATFIENGKTILTALFGGDGARMWDAETGKLRKFFPHKGLRRTTLSNNGKWLITWGGLDSDTKLWNAATGELVPPVVQHGYVTRMLAWSRDDERIATASIDHTVILWDRATMKPLFPPFKQDGEVRSVAFNAAGTRLFAGNWEQIIRVWDTATGREALPPLAHKGLSTDASLVMSPDGKWLASLSLEGTVRIWDTDTGQLAVPELHHSAAAWQMKFDSTGARLAVGCVDGAAYLWDLRASEPVSVQLKQSRKVYAINFSPDDRLLLTGSSDGTVRVWDIATEALSFSPWSNAPVSVLDIGNANKLLTQNANGTLQLLNASHWKAAAPEISLGTAITKAWLSSNETRLLTLSATPSSARSGKAIQLEFKTWDVSSARLVSTLNAVADAKWTAWVSPDCNVVAITESNRVACYDTSKAQGLWQKSLSTDGVRYMAFNNASTCAAMLTRTEAHVVDVVSGKATFRPFTLPFVGMCATFSPDDKSLVIAWGDEFTVDRHARVLNAQSGKFLSPPLEHNGLIASVAFSTDGARIVTASHDRAARIWDVRTGRLVVPPLLHEAGVSHATFSADSRWVATCTEDGVARVWSAETGEPLTFPMKSPAPLSSSRFLADGKFLFTQCTTDVVALWELPRDKRPVADWAALASVLSARRLNMAGFIEHDEGDASNDSWKTLRAKHGDDFRKSSGFTALKAPSRISAPPSTIRPMSLQ